MAFLYGHAGRLTAKNGGFRPGQMLCDIFPTMGIEVRFVDSNDPANFGKVRAGRATLRHPCCRPAAI